MSKQVRIPVPGGLVGHGRSHSEIVLREPDFREYLDIGDVVEHISYPNGMSIATVNNATVERYFKTCLVEPTDPLIVEQGGMALAKEVRKAIVNFIHGGGQEDDASPTSAATSSGAAAKDDSPPAM